MTKATVNVTIRVTCKSNWSQETTIEQINRQAIDDALLEVNNIVNHRSDMQVIGRPIVTTVTTELKDPCGSHEDS